MSNPSDSSSPTQAIPYRQWTLIAIVLAVIGIVVEIAFNNSGDPSALVSLIEIVVVIGIMMALREMAGKGLLGVASIYVGVLLAWGVLLLRNQSWANVGLTQPDNWGSTIIYAVGVTAVAFVVAGGLRRFVFPRFNLKEADVSHIANRIRGNLPMLLNFALIVWLTAALPEELIYRAFLMNWLSHLLGTTALSWLIIVILQALFFGWIHRYQGTAGIISTGVAGMILGTAYVLFDQNLWVVIIAHGLLNTFSAVLFYFGFGVQKAAESSDEQVVSHTTET